MSAFFSHNTFIVAAAALAAAGGMPAAHAALGDNLDSIARDRTQMRALARTPQVKAQGPVTGVGSGNAAAAYTVHEMVTPSGTVVREFTGADGRVFAVTWAGPTVPDLRQLLGTSFDVYAAPQPAGPRAHGHRAVVRGDLVVQSFGRMRAFKGKAYLTSLIPAGVQIDALQ